jgi:hypothetical protein
MSHLILIPTHKYKIKKFYLNPRWGISFKLGQILRCISKIMGRLPWGIDSRREIQARAPEVEIKEGRSVWRELGGRREEMRKERRKPRLKGYTEKGTNRIGTLLHTKGVNLIGALQSTVAPLSHMDLALASVASGCSSSESICLMSPGVYL